MEDPFQNSEMCPTRNCLFEECRTRWLLNFNSGSFIKNLAKKLGIDRGCAMFRGWLPSIVTSEGFKATMDHDFLSTHFHEFWCISIPTYSKASPAAWLAAANWWYLLSMKHCRTASAALVMVEKIWSPRVQPVVFSSTGHVVFLSKETEALYANTQGIALSTSLVLYVFQ